ncbi:acyltransferase [Planomonospora sp. ID67723]|uniref:acyltransferase family protein n=1 Tax=Planomonospora sp. ID67723 TaxID=2738134 RepID=UPI0018C3CA3E|nr:acyltransferase [Planomonospora sp. ID67723]MBG0829105.1 acyltransferase [Planomonospora sp. ID67723]
MTATVIGDSRPAPATRGQYFPELQGIRALAVLAVVTIHSAFASGQIGYLDQPGNGVLAVVLERFTRESLPILFALSGFLLYRPFALATIAGAEQTYKLGSYAWRRALRIFPAYLLLAVVIMFTLGKEQITGFWYVVRVVTMQHVYEPGGIPQGMESTWSMATEIAFYALLPLLAWAFHRLASGAATPAAKARRVLLPIGAIILIGYAFSAWSHHPSLGEYPVQGNWPIAWFGYLAVGMALATMSAAAESDGWLAPYRLIARNPLGTWAVAFGITILYCFSPMGDQGTANFPTTSVVLFNQPIDLLIVFLMLAPLTVPGVRSRFISAVLNITPLQFIGRVSYAMFLWHIPAIYLWNLWGTTNFPLALLLVHGTAFTAAVISYYAVERPALRLRNKLGKGSVEPSTPVLVR